jgi:hypothetical protein
MSNRLILGAFDSTFVLRVSRPGANVLDPALPVEKLAFDSRWASLAVVHQQGLVRGRMARVDMVGPVWTSSFIVPANYPNLPLVIVSARPEWTDLDWSPSSVGSAFGASYNPNTRQVEIQASAPWWPPNANTMSWGWFRYFLMRVQ